MASKPSGPVPGAVRRRRNKDALAPVQQGTRRGVDLTQLQPMPNWRTDVKNYFRAVLASGAADWYEPSDVMWLQLQCEALDRLFRAGKVVPVYEEIEEKYEAADGTTKRRWVKVLDDDGEPVPELDEWGQPQMRFVGSLNGQALKTVLDMGTELLVTEGSRRRLRIDLGLPGDDGEDERKALVAEQRANLHRALRDKGRKAKPSVPSD